jgi:hypothetical protein
MTQQIMLDCGIKKSMFVRFVTFIRVECQDRKTQIIC